MTPFSPTFSPLPGNRIPTQDGEKVLLLAEKFRGASAAHEKWALRARENTEFLEGKQWTDEQLAKLAAEGRPALTFNKIAPLWRLVVGYHANNATDIRFLPGHDGSGTEQVADVLTRLIKQITESNDLDDVDREVFADGLTTGRGWWRQTLSFDQNDFGEIVVRSGDPFSVYVDPEADTYDLTKSANYIQTTRWASYEEIRWTFGKDVADMVRPFTAGQVWNGFPSLFSTPAGEVSAERTFAEDEDSYLGSVSDFRTLFHEHFIDPARKNIRILETEYTITEMRAHFIDLETGDHQVIPDHWDRTKVEKVMAYARDQGNPKDVARRPHQRVRWVVMVGDLIVHDDWSPYETFSYIGYFPYFRRGKTRGMIDDLLDPQREYNKRRMTRLELLSRTANGGWKYSDDALDPQQEWAFKRFGTAPGFHLKFRKDATMPPEQIQAQNIPAEYAQLEEASNADIREIGGINEAALGFDGKVKSGRAMESQQRQAVIGLQMYMDNYTRSKKLQGKKFLNMIQRHYTEERVVRVMGEDGRVMQDVINQPQRDAYGRLIGKLNDVTIGKYAVVVDDTPMSATFQSAQFEEAMELAQALGLGQAMADILVDLSTMPRKDEVKERLQRMMGLAPQGGTALQTGTVPTPGGQAVPAVDPTQDAQAGQPALPPAQ